MLQDFLQEERPDGFPLFVCRSETSRSGLNWWAPCRTGDADTDYAAGVQHFRTAADLSHALRYPNFYRCLMLPEIAHEQPGSFLMNIVGDMHSVGPIERGFLDELSRAAIAGRFGQAPTDVGDTDAEAFKFAIEMLELARLVMAPRLITEELELIIDGLFYHGTPMAFVWTVCGAAAAGALS